MPPEMAFVLQALGHSTKDVRDFDDLVGQPDDHLVSHLADVDCDWLFSLDQFRGAEAWVPVYTKIADGQGRALRVHRRRSKAGGADLIANIALYVATQYSAWAPLLDQQTHPLIVLGRGISKSGRPTSGFNLWQAHTQLEVAELLQQKMAMGNPQGSHPIASTPNHPRAQQTVRTKRGGGRQ